MHLKNCKSFSSIFTHCHYLQSIFFSFCMKEERIFFWYNLSRNLMNEKLFPGLLYIFDFFSKDLKNFWIWEIVYLVIVTPDDHSRCCPINLSIAKCCIYTWPKCWKSNNCPKTVKLKSNKNFIHYKYFQLFETEEIIDVYTLTFCHHIRLLSFLEDALKLKAFISKFSKRYW